MFLIFHFSFNTCNSYMRLTINTIFPSDCKIILRVGEKRGLFCLKDKQGGDRKQNLEKETVLQRAVGEVQYLRVFLIGRGKRDWWHCESVAEHIQDLTLQMTLSVSWDPVTGSHTSSNALNQYDQGKSAEYEENQSSKHLRHEFLALGKMAIMKTRSDVVVCTSNLNGKPWQKDLKCEATLLRSEVLSHPELFDETFSERTNKRNKERKRKGWQTGGCRLGRRGREETEVGRREG